MINLPKAPHEIDAIQAMVEAFVDEAARHASLGGSLPIIALGGLVICAMNFRASDATLDDFTRNYFSRIILDAAHRQMLHGPAAGSA